MTERNLVAIDSLQGILDGLIGAKNAIKSEDGKIHPEFTQSTFNYCEAIAKGMSREQMLYALAHLYERLTRNTFKGEPRDAQGKFNQWYAYIRNMTKEQLLEIVLN